MPVPNIAMLSPKLNALSAVKRSERSARRSDRHAATNDTEQQQEVDDDDSDATLRRSSRRRTSRKVIADEHSDEEDGVMAVDGHDEPTEVTGLTGEAPSVNGDSQQQDDDDDDELPLGASTRKSRKRRISVAEVVEDDVAPSDVDEPAIAPPNFAAAADNNPVLPSLPQSTYTLQPPRNEDSEAEYDPDAPVDDDNDDHDEEADEEAEGEDDAEADTVDVGKYKLRRTSVRGGGSQEAETKLSLLEELRRTRQERSLHSIRQQREEQLRHKSSQEEQSLTQQQELADQDKAMPESGSDEEEQYLKHTGTKRKRRSRKQPDRFSPELPARSSQPKERGEAYYDKMNDDDAGLDDFVVDDDEIEEEAESDADSDNDLQAKFAADRMADMDEAEQRAEVFRRVLEDDKAFREYVRHLGMILVDCDYEDAVEEDHKRRIDVSTIVKHMEATMVDRRDNWVRSESWDKPAVKEFKEAINSLPYAMTDELNDPGVQCEACNRKHEARYRITFWGLRYSPQALNSPANPRELITGSEYEHKSFCVGELCHRRCILYHTMLHFKFHLMADLKTRIDDRISDVDGEAPDVEQLRQIVNQIADKDEHFVSYFYHSWQQLNSYSSSFTTKDSRTLRINTIHLLDMANWSTECHVELLFSHWPERLRGGLRQRKKERANVQKSHKRERTLGRARQTTLNLTSTSATQSTFSKSSPNGTSNARQSSTSSRRPSKAIAVESESEIESIDDSDADGERKEDISHKTASPAPLVSHVRSNAPQALAYFYSLAGSDRQAFLKSLAENVTRSEFQQMTQQHYKS